MSKNYLQKSIKDNVIKDKKIIFDVHSSISICLGELWEQKIIDKVVYIKASWKIRKEAGLV